MTRAGEDLQTLSIFEFILMTNTDSVVHSQKRTVYRPIARNHAGMDACHSLACGKGVQGCWNVPADTLFPVDERVLLRKKAAVD